MAAQVTDGIEYWWDPSSGDWVTHSILLANSALDDFLESTRHLTQREVLGSACVPHSDCVGDVVAHVVCVLGAVSERRTSIAMDALPGPTNAPPSSTQRCSISSTTSSSSSSSSSSATSS